VNALPDWSSDCSTSARLAFISTHSRKQPWGFGAATHNKVIRGCGCLHYHNTWTTAIGPQRHNGCDTLLSPFRETCDADSGECRSCRLGAPHELQQAVDRVKRQVQQWGCQPYYLDGGEKSTVPVLDGEGSPMLDEKGGIVTHNGFVKRRLRCPCARVHKEEKRETRKGQTPNQTTTKKV